MSDPLETTGWSKVNDKSGKYALAYDSSNDPYLVNLDGSETMPPRDEFSDDDITDGQTIFTLSQTLKAGDDVIKNGALMLSSGYSGIGTTTLTLTKGLFEGDYLIVKHY